MKNRTPPGSPRRLIPFAVLALTTAGCVPDVAWLPDSGGIVYTTTDWPLPGQSDLPAEKKGRLVHYDLAKKAPRVVAGTGTDTIRPPVSLDGKRVAVARLALEKDKDPTLQVVVYDLDGKEVHRSGTLAWGDRPRGDVTNEKYPQLFWAPKGNKVLVHANKHTGIYDPDRDRAVMLGLSVPAIYGVTPVRPDGKGFLIARPDETVAFVDWDGKPSAVEVPAGGDRHRQSALFAPGADCWGRWEGDVAVATWKGGRLRIDTAKRVAAFDTPAEAEWAWDGKEVQNLYTFPDGKTKLVVVYLKSYRDFRDAGLPTVRVDLVGPGGSRTLIPEAFHCGVYPSPNKELVALRYTVSDKRDPPRDLIRVVNRKGESVAEIDTGK